MSIEDLILLLNQDATNTLKTDKDLDRFCKSGVELYKVAVGQSSVPQRTIWTEPHLARALREGAEGDKHIDFDHVSQNDYKVVVMYRKFGFKGLEGAIEAIGARKTFAIARLVACFPDNSGGVVPFASSTKTWLERVANQMKMRTKSLQADLEIYCIGPKTRHRIGHTTWVVVDGFPARHEQILPDPTSPYLLYIPEVHMLVYSPLLQLVRRGLFGQRVEWQPAKCLAELVWALALVDNYPESRFDTLLSDVKNSEKYKTTAKTVDSVRKNIEITIAYLEHHKMIDAAQGLQDILK